MGWVGWFWRFGGVVAWVLEFAKIPQGFGTGVYLATFWLGARRICGPTFYRQPQAAWRGLCGSDESLQADETVGAALRAG